MSSTENTEIAAHLEHLCRLSHATVNARDWSFCTPVGQTWIQHVDIPHFTAQFDTYPQRLSWNELIAAWKEMLRDGGEFVVTGMETTMDQKQELGIVMVENELVGSSSGMSFRGLTEVRFRKKEGRWILYRMVAMKGPGSSTGL